MAKEQLQGTLKIVTGFFQENFGLLVIVSLFFVGGFFFGSVWTEKQYSQRQATGGSDTGQVAGQVTQPSRDLSIAGLVAKAQALGIEPEALQSCLDANQTAEKIANQVAAATPAGIGGTPSTVIVVNGVPTELIPGALPLEQIKQTIDKYLAGEGSTPNTQLASIPAVSAADHLRGNPDAKVILVEYSDFECPFCERFHPTMTQVMAEYGDKIAWVYRNFPLSFHPNAQKSAQAAECVSQLTDNQTYWQYVDALFQT